MKIITNLYITGTQEDGSPLMLSQAMPEHLANIGIPHHWQLIDSMVTERTDTNLRQIAINCDVMAENPISTALIKAKAMN